MVYYELMMGIFVLQLYGCYILWRIIKKRNVENAILKELKSALNTFLFVLFGQLFIIAIMTFVKICFR